MKKVELTQKELDQKIGEARKNGYALGLTHGRSEIYPHRSSMAIKSVILIDALFALLDERYELKKEDY